MKTPSCTQIKKHLVSLCENTLPPDLLKEIRLHLSQCPRCEKLAQDFLGLWNDLATQKEPEHRVSLWPGLEQAIKEQVGKSRRIRGFSQRLPGLLRPAAAALGLVLAIGTGWELGSLPHGSPTDFSFSMLWENSSEEMYISEYLEPFSDVPVGSLADLYLDSDSPDKDTSR